MRCPDDNVLAELADGGLEAEARSEVRHHVDDCARCRELLAALVRNSVVASGATWTATSEAHADTLLEPPSDMGPAAPRASVMPRTIGRHVVLRIVGAGGMGIVYAAYDEELDRKVAVKVLRLALGSSAEHQPRLRREARALARLSHPNVVAVYDVGEHEGQAYIAMEYVDGQSLSQWLAKPRDWRTVVDAFVAAGRGLAAAHAAGIVHRDVKPSNIMRGEDGRVWVTDFGLARDDDEAGRESAATGQGGSDGDHSLTRTGALLGTPAYMSPEQHRGERADARSDQFGFCVALYEALYGQRPFGGDSASDLAAAVAAGTVRTPPADRDVPRWLRDSVLRGLRPNPADRWPDMEALLATLQRAPSRRRTRWLAAMGAGLAVVGVVAVVLARGDADVCGAGVPRVQSVWGATQQLALRDSFARVASGPSATSASAALDAYAALWSAQHRDVCEATHVRREQSEAVLDLRMRCLEARRVELGALVDALAVEPTADVVTQSASAVAALTSPLACAEVDALSAVAPLPADPVARDSIERVREQVAQVRSLRLAHKLADALALAPEVVTQAEATGYAPVLAAALNELANLYDDDDQLELSIATFERVVAAAVAARDDELIARGWIGIVWVRGARQSRYKDALPLRRTAEVAVERAGASPRLRASLAGTLGDVYRISADYERSLELQRDAVALWEQLGQTLQRARATTGLGLTLEALGRKSEAVAAYEASLALVIGELGADHPFVGRALQNLGDIYVESSQYDQAEDAYRRAQAIWLATFGPDHSTAGDALDALANVATQRGDVDAAIAGYGQALAVYERTVGPDALTVATTLHRRANALFLVNRHDEARADWERAARIYEQVLGPTHHRLALPLRRLGQLADNRRDLAAAEAYFTRAMEITRAHLPAQHPSLIPPLISLGQFYVNSDRYLEALPLLQQAVAIGEASEASDAWLAGARFVLAIAMWEGGDHTGAGELARVARAGYAQDPDNPYNQRNLAEVDKWMRKHRVPR